jgi:hypothetical protein
MPSTALAARTWRFWRAHVRVCGLDYPFTLPRKIWSLGAARSRGLYISCALRREQKSSRISGLESSGDRSAQSLPMLAEIGRIRANAERLQIESGRRAGSSTAEARDWVIFPSASSFVFTIDRRVHFVDMETKVW